MIEIEKPKIETVEIVSEHIDVFIQKYFTKG